MEHVITISGKAMSGKDTLAKELKEQFEGMGKRVCVLHYADYLKMVARLYFGWDGNKDERGRTILQNLGTDVARKQNPDLWVDVVMMLIMALREEFDIFIIPDTRFPNEVLTPKLHFGDNYISIRVNRPNAPQMLTDEQENHASETALDDFDDFTFDVTLLEGLSNVRAMAKLLKTSILKVEDEVANKKEVLEFKKSLRTRAHLL